MKILLLSLLVLSAHLFGNPPIENNGKNIKILVIGTGYVGLVTGACFAETGHNVICLDIDKSKINLLEKGEIPFFEPGLETIVLHNLKDKRLVFTTDYQWAIENSNVCFLAVPTPSSEDGSCDISYVEKAAKEIAKHMSGYKLIVNKSTALPGTVYQIKKVIQNILDERGVQIDFDVASNPEFLKEGDAIFDFMRPDRVVIGTENEKALSILKNIYSAFCFKHERFIEMDIVSAEMTKYAANAMLACRISFMNEVAKICEKVGADITNVRKGIGSDRRIGYDFLYAGIGFGGSCFPKDVQALSSLAREKDIDSLLLDAIISVNDQQKMKLSKMIEKYFSLRGGLKNKTIAIWGLSFKANTSDIREAPSLVLIDYLLKKGVKLRLYDPVAMPEAKRIITHKNITWCKDEIESAEGADAIALVTEWKQFRCIDFDLVCAKMKRKVLFDGRNQYKPKEMKRRGFDYFGIGRPPILEFTRK